MTSTRPLNSKNPMATYTGERCAYRAAADKSDNDTAEKKWIFIKQMNRYKVQSVDTKPFPTITSQF